MKACCATCASRRRASSRSPWWRRWSRRKKTSWKRRKRETSRQDLPRVRIRRACARLQGRPDLEPLPHRARQDSAQPVVGNVCAAPAAARDGDQARAAARLDSVHQGSHSINTKPSWWRLLLALVAFVFWAPASLVGLDRPDSPAPRTRTRPAPGVGATTTVSCLCCVTLDVRNQGELPRALDRRRELPLVPRTHSRQPAGQNLAALGEEAAQGPVVLVVEHTRAGFAHGAGLGGTSHASSSSSSSSSGATTAATTGFGCSRDASTHM